MSTTIRDLWPEDVSAPDVLSPLTILKYQASQLRQRTKGLLEAEVHLDERSGPWVRASFVIIAPFLDRYRLELFRIGHDSQSPYPVFVYASDLAHKAKSAGFVWAEVGQDPDDYSPPDEDEAVASSQEEFLDLLALVLNSRNTKSVLQSLLARTNDVQQAHEPQQTPE